MYALIIIVLNLLILSNSQRVVNSTAVATTKNAVQIKPSKIFYSDGDETINLQCEKWSSDQVVKFFMVNDKQQYKLIYNSKDNTIAPDLTDYFSVNDANDGLTIHLGDRTFEPLLCEVNGKRSDMLQLNHVTMPLLKLSSNILEEPVNISCPVVMRPKERYSLEVEFYADGQLVAKVYELSRDGTLANGEILINGFQDFEVSGTFNSDYRLLLTRTGDRKRRSLHCIVRTTDLPNNFYISETVILNPDKSSAGTAMASWSLISVSILFFTSFM